MVIPRERQLVRLYIQLANLSPGRGERFDKLSGTPELILEAAQKIMEPYSIRYDYCEWWTVYQVCPNLSKKIRTKITTGWAKGSEFLWEIQSHLLSRR